MKSGWYSLTVRLRLFVGRRGLGTTLGQAGLLTHAITEEVQLGTANNTMPLDDHVSDLGAVDGEGSLDTFAGDDPANGEHFTHTRSTHRNYDAGVDLDAFFIPVQNSGVDINTVPDLEIEPLFADVRLFSERDELVHGVVLTCLGSDPHGFDLQVRTCLHPSQGPGGGIGKGIRSSLTRQAFPADVFVRRPQPGDGVARVFQN